MVPQSASFVFTIVVSVWDVKKGTYVCFGVTHDPVAE